MELTSATTADIDPIVDCWIELAVDQRRYGSHLVGESNRRNVRRTVARRVISDDIVVARAEGEAELAGFAMYSTEYGRYEQDVVRGVVENIYVRPPYRNEGLGSDLLALVEDRLADAGVEVVALEAMADNASARRFYERHGYEPHRVELEKRLDESSLEG